jgi:hypothetical protein
MGFGALFLLACSAAITELWRGCFGQDSIEHVNKILRWHLLGMTVAAWLAVLSGAYIIYPWYRAVPPTGTHELTMFPQLLPQVHSENCRMAFAGHGMERACGLDFAHRNHDADSCVLPSMGVSCGGIGIFAERF